MKATDIVRLHKEQRFDDIFTDGDEILLKMFSNYKGGAVFDLGSGGFKFKQLLNKDNFSVTTIDIDKSKCDIVMNLEENLELKSDSADYIILMDSLEHIKNHDNLLKECRRVLKNNGKMIVSTPNLCSYDNRIKIFFGIKPDGYPPSHGHVVLWNLSGIRNTLRANGFETTKIVGRQGYIIKQTEKKYDTSKKRLHQLLGIFCKMFPSIARGWVIECTVIK